MGWGERGDCPWNWTWTGTSSYELGSLQTELLAPFLSKGKFTVPIFTIYIFHLIFQPSFPKSPALLMSGGTTYFPNPFALLVSFIIFMFSIGPMYIPFLWDPRSNWQQAGWEPSSLSKGNEDDVMGSPGKMSLACTFQINPVNPSSASPKCPCACQTFFSPFLSVPDSGGFGGQNVMF